MAENGVTPEQILAMVLHSQGTIRLTREECVSTDFSLGILVSTEGEDLLIQAVDEEALEELRQEED